MALGASTLDDIYAALDDDAALAALPATVARACDARSGSVQVAAPGGWRLALTSYFTPAMLADYDARFLPHDIWSATGARLCSRRLVNALDELIPPERFANSLYFNEFFRAHGDDTGRSMGAYRAGSGGAPPMIAVQRPLAGRAFDARDQRRLGELYDHVARVLRARRIADTAVSRARRLSAMLDRLGTAAALLGPGLRLLAAAPAFEDLIAANDGLAVKDRRLALADPAAAARLRRVVEATLARQPAGEGALMAARPSGRAAYRLLVLPAGDAADGALLVVEDPADDGASRLRWAAALYGLTPAESDLTAALLAGRTLDEAAADRGVRPDTVRTQLKSLFAKTDTRRQAELTALFARLPSLR